MLWVIMLTVFWLPEYCTVRWLQSFSIIGLMLQRMVMETICAAHKSMLLQRNSIVSNCEI